MHASHTHTHKCNTLQNEKNNFSRIYERRSEDVPPVPLETKYHPSAVDVTILRKLAEETKCKTLLQFFRQDFESIGTPRARTLTCTSVRGMSEFGIGTAGGCSEKEFVFPHFLLCTDGRCACFSVVLRHTPR